MKTFRTEEITPDLLASLKYDESFSPEEVEAIVALARTIYAPAQLQSYLDRDDGVPLEEVLQEIEQSQRDYEARNP